MKFDGERGIPVRYARQTILGEVGAEGQKALREARVLIVGVGGLGSPLALYLCAAGVGTLGLVEGDRVSLSNLARQILFQTPDTGQLKGELAKRNLERLNPETEVVVHPFFLDSDNAEALAQDYDILVDATDNFASKYLLNDLAVKLDKPLVHGSILRWQGQASVFWASRGPCYRCLYPHPPEGHVPNCAEAGVIGALAGMIGSLEALEVIKLVLAKAPGRIDWKDTLIGRIWTFDAKAMTQSTIHLAKDPDCPVCSRAPADILLPRVSAPASCALIEVDRAQAEWGNFRFIDVREDKEWREGRIPEAIHWPLSRLRAGETPVQNPTERLIVYCQSGIRSQQAITLLANAGWDLSSVQDLQGGFGAWVGPVERDR